MIAKGRVIFHRQVRPVAANGNYRRSVVRRSDSNRPRLFHRLGILLVILGMIQSLAPTCLRSARPSLRLSGQVRVALASRDDSDLLAHALPGNPPLVTESRQEEESDQESHDTEPLAETMAWSEALAEHRSPERSASESPLCSIGQPGRGAERTRSALQRTRTLPILSIASSSVTTRLCRFLC